MSETNGATVESSHAIRRLVVAAAVVLAIAAAIYALDPSLGQADSVSAISPGASAGPAPRIGAQAPNFQALDLNGKRVSLQDFRGKPVWLNFWASWCPPCRAETPDMEAAYREKQGDGLVLLAISVGEDAEAVRQYAQAVGVTYAILLDGDQAIAARYRVNGLPTHYFVDQDGVIRGIQSGGLSKSAVLKRLALIMPAR